jgi:gamma-glutamyltranspeptidase/glutathione hydrolase
LVEDTFSDSEMKGMVVAPHSLAVAEGVKVLQEGGNAIDAAITAALTQCVVGVGMCGIAGFGSMHLYLTDSGDDMIIDFHGRAGSKATPDIWQDLIVMENRSGYGYTLKGAVNDTGYQSITTSGTIRAFYKALNRYGTIKWKRAIESAAKFAEEGYTVSEKQAILWRLLLPVFGFSMRDKYSATPFAEKIFLKNGEPYNVGEKLIQTKMDLKNSIQGQSGGK